MISSRNGSVNNRVEKQRRGTSRLWLTGGLSLLFALLLVACSSATPTSTPVPAPTATSVPEAMTTPSVTVMDQEIVDGTVTIAQVVSDGPGWIVIHADQDGKPGPVLGQTAVQDGENADIIVALAEEGRTETLYAMLHTDAGQIGTYEFPGDDGPVQVDGKVITPAFQAAGGLSEMIPSVTAMDQEIVDGTVTIAQVVSDGPGWIVIHADQDGKPGPVLGQTAVQDGENADVIVALAEEGRTETLYAMLHTDAGQIGTYEFPGDDGPVQVDGKVITPAFQAAGGLSEMTPSVTVMDQEVVDGTVTIAQVVSDGPGWIVIHADQDGKPGPVLGQTAVQDGENADIIVALAEEGRTETLYAMLHTDAGQIGTYEFPGDDGPVQVDGKVITPAFQAAGGLSEMTPSVTVMDQEIVDGTVTIAQVISDGPGWIVIHADQDGKPGPVLGQTAVQDGENADIVVALDLNDLTGTLYAMLHTDAGQVGSYEFPGDDVPVKQGEAIVLAPFGLQVTEGEAVDVSMINFTFSPAQLFIRAGTTVTWTNNDGAVGHTVTADDGAWDSGLFSGGGNFSLTFDQPGVFAYYCQPHGGPNGQGMAGTIIVIP